MASLATPLQPSLQLLEHINLNVPHASRDTVSAFFVAIGAAPNPSGSVAGRQLHFNVGVSQFHLPYVKSVTDPEPVLPKEAQVWRGTIEMVTTEDPARIAARLRNADSPALQRCVVGLRDKVGGGKVLALRCPWAAECTAGVDTTETDTTLGETSAAALLIHGGGGDMLETRVRACEGHDGGMGTLIAMTRVTHLVQPGAAAHLHRFFTDILGCTAASMTRSMSSPNVSCTVPFLSDAGSQLLVFQESSRAGLADAYDTDLRSQYHLALYLPSAVQFSRAFARANQLGVIFVNPRFRGGPLEFASSTTLEEAMASGQFRVKNLIHPETGQIGLTLELEVRSPTHCCFPFADAIPSNNNDSGRQSVSPASAGASADDDILSAYASSGAGSGSDRPTSFSPSTPPRTRRRSHSRSDVALVQVAMSPPGSPSLSYQQQQNMVSLLMTAGSPQRSPTRSALPMSPLHRAHVTNPSESHAIPDMTL